MTNISHTIEDRKTFYSVRVYKKVGFNEQNHSVSTSVAILDDLLSSVR